MKKQFMVLSGLTLAADGIPRIYLPIETEDAFTDEWVSRVLSQWGKKIASESLFLFEFPPDHRRFQDALAFLLAHGYDEIDFDATLDPVSRVIIDKETRSA